MMDSLLSMFSSCSCAVPSSPEIDIRGGSKKTKYRSKNTPRHREDERIVKTQLTAQKSLPTSRSTVNRETKVDSLVDPRRIYTSTESREIVEKLNRILNEED